MSYTIKWHSEAQKFLNNLPVDISNRIIKKLEALRVKPFRYLEHYEGLYYKMRIGDYRVLIDVEFNDKILIIMVLDKRGRIYKR
ncbi:hypothetical protein COU61_01380 [Candidatus Pacearchaeota archaeon CG10_big_fil_rev_8_21_14_0_10_35_13]|nr:MAG: hypothetical protein COU61_01380 [Candidatus Pacearchaeota archaeon CG10_big_fil_rev_8_21_14_0_10_35_13]